MDDPTDKNELLGPPVVRPADATALGMAYQIIATPDGERRFAFVGQRCLGLNGISAEAAMANPAALYEMILPEHRETFAKAEAEAMAAGKAFDIEVAMRRADGQVRWHRIASMPRPLPDGSTAWDGLQIDVTDRRQMAAALAEQRRRLEIAAEATGLGFWEWDVTADRVVWSERNKALFGLPPDAPEMTIAEYARLVLPEDLPRVSEAYMQMAADGGGDFAVEHRVRLAGDEVRWILSHGRLISEAGAPKLVVGTSLDITRRKAADERRALLMGELAHRAKNGIAVLMAMVQQTARSSDTVKGFEELLMARLQSMATAQDLVTATGGRPVSLLDVVGQTLTPFGLSRIDVSPELGEVMVAGEIAVALGLLLHEMATNAIKYGALSNTDGGVRIVRGDARPGQVVLHWCESGGPTVKRSRRDGFGVRLLATALRTQGGQVDFSFEPAGFEARVAFPPAG